MKIYTKTGDKGTTGLIGGTRVPKYHIRLECYGTVDELNAHLGLVRSLLTDKHDNNALKKIQEKIFTICSLLASETDEVKLKMPQITEADIHFLEKEMDRMDESLEPITNFIIPGNSTFAAFCHISRTVCRRAERRVNELALQANIDSLILIYLNRLSDYLFTLSRKISNDSGMEENHWKGIL